MKSHLLKDRRPSELEIEVAILKQEMEFKGEPIPRRSVLVWKAERRLEERDSRISRQESFNRRGGWGNKPFANLTVEG